MKVLIRSLKLIIILLFVIIASLNLMSCLYVKDTMKEKKDLDFRNQIGVDIIESLKNQDCDKLSSVFCEKIANTKYLNDNINYLFNYINANGGLIIPDGKWVLRGSGHRSFNSGKKVVDRGGWDYDKEVMIGEKKYKLICSTYFVLAGHKEYEGITCINMLEVTNISDEDFLNKTIKALNEKGSKVTEYLGVGIFNMNYETYLDENVAPKEIYENEEYRFSFDELEKGHSKW